MKSTERARLEETVFGPPGRYGDAEVARATERLRLLLAHEDAPAPIAEEPADDDGEPRGRRRVLIAGAAVLAGAVLTGIGIWAANPHPVESLTVFDRAQTAADVDAAIGVRGALGSSTRRLDAPPGVTAVAFRDDPLDVCMWVRGRSACVSELHFRQDGLRVVGYRWGPTGTTVARTPGG